MENKKYNIESLTMAQIHKSEISQEILDLIKGKESYVDTDTELNEKIYSIDALVEILDSIDARVEILEFAEFWNKQELKREIATLYEQVKDYNYLQVVSI